MVSPLDMEWKQCWGTGHCRTKSTLLCGRLCHWIQHKPNTFLQVTTREPGWMSTSPLEWGKGCSWVRIKFFLWVMLKVQLSQEYLKKCMYCCTLQYIIYCMKCKCFCCWKIPSLHFCTIIYFFPTFPTLVSSSGGQITHNMHNYFFFFWASTKIFSNIFQKIHFHLLSEIVCFSTCLFKAPPNLIVFCLGSLQKSDSWLSRLVEKPF